MWIETLYPEMFFSHDQLLSSKFWLFVVGSFGDDFPFMITNEFVGHPRCCKHTLLEVTRIRFCTVLFIIFAGSPHFDSTLEMFIVAEAHKRITIANQTKHHLFLAFPLPFLINLSQYSSIARLRISDAENPIFLDIESNRLNCKSDK
jgi:hypothetical protein